MKRVVLLIFGVLPCSIYCSETDKKKDQEKNFITELRAILHPNGDIEKTFEIVDQHNKKNKLSTTLIRKKNGVVCTSSKIEGEKNEELFDHFNRAQASQILDFLGNTQTRLEKNGVSTNLLSAYLLQTGRWWDMPVSK